MNLATRLRSGGVAASPDSGRAQSAHVFDVLRVVAIAIILVHHIQEYTFNFFDLTGIGLPIDWSWLNDLSRYFALGLFVFISGYVNALSHPALHGGKEIGAFLLKRYLRVVPLYLVVLPVFVWMLGEAMAPMSALSSTVHFLGLQALLASRDIVPVQTLWYVGVILVYYLIYCLLARFAASGRALAAWYLLLMSAALGLHALLGIVDKRVPLYLGVFVTGIAAARYDLLARLRARELAAMAALFVAAVGYYALVLYPAISGNPDKPSAYSGLGAQAFVVTNVIMLAFVGVLHGVVAGRATAGKGDMLHKIALASYCMYLFHRPVWWGMCRVYDPASGPARLVYLAVVGIPFIYVLSFRVQTWYTTRIEVNAAGWIRRMSGAAAAR